MLYMPMWNFDYGNILVLTAREEKDYYLGYTMNVVIDSSSQTKVSISRYCLRKLGQLEVPDIVHFKLKRFQELRAPCIFSDIGFEGYEFSLGLGFLSRYLSVLDYAEQIISFTVEEVTYLAKLETNKSDGFCVDKKSMYWSIRECLFPSNKSSQESKK
ncbi:hypothetical protein Pmani_016744 [Petrolisthes manimaculis]|uniref:MATH domain-containing protein n=1 Tax=Petrolisthes manimaculis TaxID=1843537 RepID=A0AAE1PNU2_9EUCA|nr:hypothetical protein Pmani_016744 [Petrolisthes manimaculis]